MVFNIMEMISQYSQISKTTLILKLKTLPLAKSIIYTDKMTLPTLLATIITRLTLIPPTTWSSTQNTPIQPNLSTSKSIEYSGGNSGKRNPTIWIQSISEQADSPRSTKINKQNKLKKKRRITLVFSNLVRIKCLILNPRIHDASKKSIALRHLATAR